MSTARLAPTARLAIAVDGGGTKTVACVAAAQETGESTILATATAGPGNLAAVGLALAKSNVSLAIAESIAQANVSGQPIERLVAGLAGIEATNHRDELVTWARHELKIDDAVFLTDVELVLLAGRRELPAIALISGTGSVALGCNRNGDFARCGGRGYLIGDEGSGFWIGQQGLRAAVRALDHAAPKTALVERFIGELGCQTADAWTQSVYTDPDPRKKLARMAKLVVETAEQGDPVAAAIVHDAGGELAQLVASVARQLDLARQTIDLILAGSVLVNAESVRQAMADHCSALEVDSIRIVDSPAREAAKRVLCKTT